MNIAVLGTGFGVHHVELYKKMGAGLDIILWGRNKDKLVELEKKLEVKTTTNL